jgi:hypothetical protein
MFGIPYNAISWMIGFLAVYTFAYRSYLAYKKTGNEIAKIYCGMSLAFDALYYRLNNTFEIIPF